MIIVVIIITSVAILAQVVDQGTKTVTARMQGTNGVSQKCIPYVLLMI